MDCLTINTMYHLRISKKYKKRNSDNTKRYNKKIGRYKNMDIINGK